MAHKNPVVLSTDGKKHETLGSGDTLAPGSIPISAESGNGLSVKSDGLFAEPGGGGGGLTEIAHNNSLSGAGTTASPLAVRVSGRAGNAIQFLDLASSEGGLFAALASGGGIPGFGEPNIIPDPTDIGIVEAKYYDLLMDSSITEGVMYHYPTLTSGGETLENVGQGVMLYAIPAGDGVIASYSGVFAGSNQQGLRVRYMDSGNTVLLVENMRGLVLNTDSTLTGWGELSSQLAVQVSADLQNELTVLQPENSDTPGLFARPISAMLFAADDSIVKTSNYQGNPKNAAIAARISTRANNNLRLIPNSESTAERGLFASKMTRGTGGGNWSFGYPDSPGAKNACGKIGSGVYWKSTVEMSNANAGDVNVKVDVWIKNLPCMEDGTLVSHRVLVDYASATTSAKPTAAIWLICDTAPTHMINIETKTITKLQRSPDALTTGLPDYPTAPDGEFAQEFTYSRQYFYMA